MFGCMSRNSLFFVLIQIVFEAAIYNSFRNVYPLDGVRGRYSQFGQADRRKVVELGLKGLFNVNVEFRACVESLAALFLDPNADIDFAWNINQQGSGRRML